MKKKSNGFEKMIKKSFRHDRFSRTEKMIEHTSKHNS